VTEELISTCEVLTAEQVTEEAIRYFDKIYIPWKEFGRAVSEKGEGKAELCALLPAIAVNDGETARILTELKESGCRVVMVHTLGQLKQAKEMGMTVDGSFRLNLTNTKALETWYGLGLERVVISRELKLPAIRDLGYPCGVTVYGKIPLMLTQRCFVSDGGCAKKGKGAPCKAVLSDRKGERFPVFSDGDCRSVIYNSRPLWMADRLSSIRNMSAMHFMFTDETAAEIADVISAYDGGAAPMWISLKEVRRL
jgi:putative protease